MEPVVLIAKLCSYGGIFFRESIARLTKTHAANTRFYIASITVFVVNRTTDIFRVHTTHMENKFGFGGSVGVS